MLLITETLQFQTKGHTDIVDITPKVKETVFTSGLREGSVLLFVIGSTAGITTVEYEPGLVETDIPAVLDKLAPYGHDYAHHEMWGDDNGASHVRASLIGSSLEIPFVDREIIVGAWQQIIVLDFDTRSRLRKIVAQLKGIK